MAAKAGSRAGDQPAPNRTEEEREGALRRALDDLQKLGEAKEEAERPVQAVKKRIKALRGKIELDGFPLATVDKILAMRNRSRGDLANEAEIEAWMLRAAGLPVGGTKNPFKEDVVLYDGDYWEDYGKQLGLAGKPGEVPAGCPPEFHQRLLKGWGIGQEQLAWALSDRGVNPEGSRTDIAVSPVEHTAEDGDDVPCPTCGGPEGEGPPDDADVCPDCGLAWDSADEEKAHATALPEGETVS